MSPEPVLYLDGRVTLHHGDCLDVLRTLPDNSVHAVVTDPPYALSFMGRGWDTHATPRAFQGWCELWAAECLRVLRPGGHMLAFGGTRTWHRLTCAVEDAGFEIRDSIAWLYGSGFPKSLDVSKAIDKAAPRAGMFADFAAHYAVRRKASGLTHGQVCEAGEFYAAVNHGGASVNWERGYNVPTLAQWAILAPLLGLSGEWLPLIERVEAERDVIEQRTTTRTTRSWEATGGMLAPGERDTSITAPATDAAQQWAGWGTALKPAFEPIVVARKPLVGTVAANVQAWGTGALNVDATRIRPFGTTHGSLSTDADAASVQGRWPSNVALDGDMADAVGDEARFFPSFRYQAKAPTRERPKVDGVAHATVKPLELMRWLVRLVTPPGGTVLEPFAGSGTTVEACILEGFNCIAIEREADYLPLIQARIERATVAQSSPPSPQLGLFDDDGDAA